MAGVNIKMGVSGVAQFKQAMKESQAAVKTLDAELKLNEQQFRLTGDAEKYLQDKSSLLEKQIKEQSNTVQQAQRALEQMEKNGVNKNSVAFQQMQQSMIRAKTDLVNMQTELQNVGSAGENAAEGVDSMNDELAAIGRGISWQNVTAGIEGVTGMLEKGARAAWNMGKRLVQATLGAGAWADDLATEAQAWEITPETLYRMQETARIIDTDADTILSARQKLTQGLGKESKEALGAFADLVKNGLLPEDYDPRRQNPADAFWDAGQALMQLNDEYDKQVYAQALFGRSWRELVPLFSAGREEYEKTMDSWTWLGDDQLENLTNLNDAEQKLTSEWEAFQREFEAALAPTMTTVMETLQGLLKEFNTYLQSEDGQKMLQAMGEALTGLVQDLANIDPEQAMEGIKGVFDSIIDGFKWLNENKNTVVEALKWIVAGWAGLKLTGGALDVLKLIDGVTNLGGRNKSPSAPTVESPSAPTGGSPSATGGGTGGGGWLAGVGSKLKSLGIGALKTAPFALPFALGIGGIIEDIKWVQEATARGQEEMAEVAAKAETYSGNEMYGIWKTLTDYNTLSGKGAAADTEAAQAFAQEWIDYINDRDGEIDNPQLMNLWEQLYNADILDQFTDSMLKLQNGDMLYSEEEKEEFFGPISTALDLIEQDMSQRNNETKVTPEDLAKLDLLPGAIGDAVRSGMASVTIVISGDAVDAMTPRISRNQAKSFFHEFG